MISDWKQPVFIQYHLSHNTVLSSSTFGYKVKLSFGWISMPSSSSNSSLQPILSAKDSDFKQLLKQWQQKCFWNSSTLSDRQNPEEGRAQPLRVTMCPCVPEQMNKRHLQTKNDLNKRVHCWEIKPLSCRCYRGLASSWALCCWSLSGTQSCSCPV